MTNLSDLERKLYSCLETFFAAAEAAASIYVDAKILNVTYMYLHMYVMYLCMYVRTYIGPQKISYLQVT